MEAILETKAETILQFIRGLRGSLYVTLKKEPGCLVADLLQTSRRPGWPAIRARNALLKRDKSDRKSMHVSCPAVVSGKAQPGVPRRTGYPHSEGTGTQLHHDNSRF